MDNFNNKEYQEDVEKKKPKPRYVKNVIWAFTVGGIICTIGQMINNYLISKGLGKEGVAAATSILLIFIGALLTGLGVYDKIGNKAGAGSIIPITGFSNSIVSPAMEHKSEGYVLGVASNMFKVAGPVLVYGFGSSIIVGMIYLLINK